MPLDKRMTHSDIVRELMDKFDKTGTIGNNAPKSRKEALAIANAIAYQTKIEEGLKDLKECLAMMMDVFPVYAIGQVSYTRTQAEKAPKKSYDGEKKLGDVVDNAN